MAGRRSDPESKRNSLVALTDQGRELFERVAPAHMANERRLLASLSNEDRRVLVGLLRKLLVEFEGSAPIDEDGRRLGVVLTPAHVTMELRESVGLPEVAGLLVRSVEPDSPAAQAGIEPGDLLIGGNDRELRSSSSLYAAARQAEELVRASSPPFLTNHCFRSHGWAVALAERDHVHFDAELLYIAALLHDLGLLAEFDTGRCFELDSAAAAANLRPPIGRKNGVMRWRRQSAYMSRSRKNSAAARKPSCSGTQPA